MWGKTFQLTIFGESHGPALGITISGCRSGILIPFEHIQEELARRAPGQKNTTTRIEKDDFQIVSGVLDGKTTGAPITVLFENHNISSKDYEIHKTIPRPNHADYPAQVKYKGFQDVRGGGHFSGRLTAPLVFAGSLAKAILLEKAIKVESFLLGREELEQKLPSIISSGDSIGASIQCQITGVPAGIGRPFFDSVESSIAHLAFSIPGLKGIEFGLGFAFEGKQGSEVSDGYRFQNGTLITEHNYNGGLLGGISTGMPIVFRVVFKPTPSIYKTQHSVNLQTKEEVLLNITGRHDPCIALRAQVVVESIAAIAILDQIWSGEYYE